MAVTVVQKTGEIDEFKEEGDYYIDFHDGKLEVHRADGTVKVYSKGSWATVDGKPVEDDLLS